MSIPSVNDLKTVKNKVKARVEAELGRTGGGNLRETANIAQQHWRAESERREADA